MESESIVLPLDDPPVPKPLSAEGIANKIHQYILPLTSFIFNYSQFSLSGLE
jgi:hypothetical protein